MPILAHFLKLMPCIRGYLLLAGMMAGLHAPIAAAAIREEMLTVAFLYNFLKLAEWPEGAVTDGLTLCVTENAALGQELETLAGRTAQDKSVRIKRIGPAESPLGCQLLFLPREEKPVRIREWLETAENSATLTVSNMEEFLDMGGMIVLINDGNRLQFEVNLEPVKRSGLKLSSQMLQIAREVRGK